MSVNTKGTADLTAHGCAERFFDHYVVYRSEHDPSSLFVAHSLRTDQIGMGKSAVHAIKELYKALRVLLRAADEDPSVEILQPAPQTIVQLFLDAPKLPDSILREISGGKPGQFAAIDEYWELVDEGASDTPLDKGWGELEGKALMELVEA